MQLLLKGLYFIELFFYLFVPVCFAEDTSVKPSTASLLPKASQTKLTLYYEDRIPYSFNPMGEGVMGLIANPVKTILTKANISFAWRLLPFHLQLETLKKNQHAACAVGAFKTEERKSYLLYSEPVFQDNPMVILARSSLNFKGDKTVPDLFKDKSKTLLVKQGYRYGKVIDRLIIDLRPTVKTSERGNITNVAMVLNGDADYIFIEPRELDVLVLIMGLTPDSYKIISFPSMPMGEKRYLACSKITPPQWMEAINREILALNKKN